MALKQILGIATQAKTHEIICGDAVACWRDHNKTLLCVADGLGHGELAAQAAQKAIAFIQDWRQKPLSWIFESCDASLRATRGLVLGLALIDYQENCVHYAGVGNIRAIYLGDKKHRFVNTHGIIGGGFNRLFINTHPISAGHWIIMYSDGIDELADIQLPVHLMNFDVQQTTEHLLTELATGHDDASMLIFKIE
jgi:serine/threonine protein phosphatase PrpC